MNLNIETIRKDFPILSTTCKGKPWVYLDSAATTQKPQCVIDCLLKAYTTCNANVHRGVYKMSRETTSLHENARKSIARFMNAKETEILFTRGTTEGINLIAATYGEQVIAEGDEIIVSTMEHHSNIVPWQQLALRKKAKLRVIALTQEGDLDRVSFSSLLNERTKIVSIAHVSNVLGTINPIQELIAEVRKNSNARVVIDGAQGIAHEHVDVRELDCDFYAFSGHKIYAPTGIGVLYGKEEILDAMPPYHFGGEMIEKVSFEKTDFNTLPYKFEAGTPDYVGSQALATAINYVDQIGLSFIKEHEQSLLHYAMEKLSKIEGIHFYGTSSCKGGVISFALQGAHPYDVGILLDEQGLALRSGQLCAEPLLTSLGVNSVLRASFGIYNTKEEIDRLEEALRRIQVLL